MASSMTYWNYLRRVVKSLTRAMSLWATLSIAATTQLRPSKCLCASNLNTQIASPCYAGIMRLDRSPLFTDSTTNASANMATPIPGNIVLKFSTILELLQLSKAKFSASTEAFRQTSRLLIRFVYSKEEWNFHMKGLSVTCCGPTLKTSRLGRFLQEAPDGCSDPRSQTNSATSTISN